jgi:hypothetical protein
MHHSVNALKNAVWLAGTSHWSWKNLYILCCATAAGDASVPVLLFVPPAQRKTFLIAPHSLSRSLTDTLYIYRL